MELNLGGWYHHLWDILPNDESPGRLGAREAYLPSRASYLVFSLQCLGESPNRCRWGCRLGVPAKVLWIFAQIVFELLIWENVTIYSCHVLSRSGFCLQGRQFGQSDSFPRYSFHVTASSKICVTSTSTNSFLLETYLGSNHLVLLIRCLLSTWPMALTSALDVISEVMTCRPCAFERR